MKTHTEKGSITQENDMQHSRILQKADFSLFLASFFLLMLMLIPFIIIKKEKEKNKKIEEEKKKKEAKLLVEKNKPTLKKLLASVVDIKSYKKLEKKANEMAYKYEHESMDVNGNYSDSLEKINDIYIEAVYQATEKVLHVQYLPNIDLDSTEIEIENAYKIFPISEKEEKIKEFGCPKDEMDELALVEYIDVVGDKKPKYLTQLIQYHKIINDKELTFEQIVKKANNFSLRYNEFNKQFNYNLLKLGDEWAKKKLEKLGVPKIDKLFEMGFNTPKNIVNMNPDSLKDEKGVGVDTLKKLRLAVERIKKEYNI